MMFCYISERHLKQTLLTASLLLLCCIQSAPAAKAALAPWPAENTTAEFTLHNVNNQLHTMAEYKDKVVLVDFRASWRPLCIQEMPEHERLKQDCLNSRLKSLLITPGKSDTKPGSSSGSSISIYLSRNHYLHLFLSMPAVLFDTACAAIQGGRI